MEKYCKEKSEFSIAFFGIIIALSWYIMPVMKFYVRDATAMLFCLVLCFCLSVGDTRIFKTFFGIIAISFLLSLCVSWLNYGLTFQSFTANFVHLILFFEPVIFLLYVYEKRNYVDDRILVFACTALIAITFFSTYTVLLSNPMAARSLASLSAPEELIMQWRKSNVGGFSSCYAMGLLCIFDLYLVKNTEWGKKKIIYIAIAVLMMVFLIMAQYVTLLLLVCICGAFVFLRNERKTNGLFIIVIMLIVFTIGTTILSSVLAFFSDISDSPVIQRRLLEMSTFLSTGDMGASLSSRFDCYKKGLELFVQAPFSGNLISSYEIDIWHSTIVGYMVKSGIVGTILYLLLMKSCVKKSKSLLPPVIIKEAYQPCVIYVLLLAFLNPIDSSHEIAAYLFFYIPLVLIRRTNNQLFDGEY